MNRTQKQSSVSARSVKSKFLSILLLLIAGVAAVEAGPASSKVETIDLKGLAIKARPCVMMLAVSDQGGKEIATGSGFCISADGKLITNRHVVEDGAAAVAKAENGAWFVVEGVLAVDEENDLVLLKIQGNDLPFLQLGRRESIEVGMRVAVIGSPLGLEGTLSDGVVSAVRKGPLGDGKWLQITAPISAGSSGSPVLNPEGDVIGVATLLMRGGQGLNFAVTVDAVQGLIKKASESTQPKSLRVVFEKGKRQLWADKDFRVFHVAHRAGDHVEALRLIKAVVSRFADSAEAYFWLGNFWLGKVESQWVVGSGRTATRNGPEAEVAFKRAVELKPDYWEAWDYLGLVYHLGDKLPEACDALLTAVKIRPDSLSWLRLGHVYKEQHSYAKAVEAYRKAVALKPDNETAWCGLGSALEKQKRFREALVAYQQAFGLAPKKGEFFETIEMEESLYGIGVCHFQLGDLKEAESSLAQMQKVNPKRAEELRALIQSK